MDNVLQLARAFQREHGHKRAIDVLRAVHDAFGERLALVSSFGANSAVLLRMAAKVDPQIAVLFLQTGMHFGETLRYRDELAAHLGLTNVIDLAAKPLEVVREDPDATLNARDPDACCALRKVRPLGQALAGYDAWITGRRRDQSFGRSRMDVFEADGPRLKINPLASWSQDDVDAIMFAHELPPHPLVAEGYPSIGCAPCTTPVAAGEALRDGRWRGVTKTECGIHLTRH